MKGFSPWPGRVSIMYDCESVSVPLLLKCQNGLTFKERQFERDVMLFAVKQLIKLERRM
jgi:hypothetical protein